MPREKIKYEDLTLEECLEIRKTCFDKNGKCIDEDTLNLLKLNDSYWSWIYSKEHLEELLNSDDLEARGAAESFLDKCHYPDNYWEMPDYYYPGIYNDLHGELNADFQRPNKDELMKIKETTTRNEGVLNNCGWHRLQWDKLEYFWDIPSSSKITFDKETESVSISALDQETGDIKYTVKLTFGLICGIFLKCRELEYSKPKELLPHDEKKPFAGNPMIHYHAFDK